MRESVWRKTITYISSCSVRDFILKFWFNGDMAQNRNFALQSCSPLSPVFTGLFYLFFFQLSPKQVVRGDFSVPPVCVCVRVGLCVSSDSFTPPSLKPRLRSRLSVLPAQNLGAGSLAALWERFTHTHTHRRAMRAHTPARLIFHCLSRYNVSQNV